jgi:hypothetical protein
MKMTLMTEATGVLRNRANTVRSTLQRRQRAIRRTTRITPEKLIKQVTQRFEKPKARRVPVAPIVIASSAAVVGVVVGIVVLRRFLAVEQAPQELEEVNPETEAYERAVAKD